MENNDFVTTITNSFYELVDGAVAFVPKLIVALLLLLVGFIVARAVSKLVRAGLSYIENNSMTQKFFSSVDVTMITISDITALFVRYAILLIFINAAVDVLELQVLSSTFDAILAFVPKIFAAVIVAGLTLLAGNVVKDLVSESTEKAGVKAHKGLGSAARAVVLVFGFPLAAAQLGLDLTIINNNITVVMAGIMLALGLAFGLGGRETAAKIIDSTYRNYRK